MGSQVITFSPSDIDQSDQQKTGAAQAVPTGDSTITFSPSDIDKTTAAPSVSMVGPNGEKKMVRPDNVASMRQQNFAVTPDNPDVVKMVSPQGQVNYVLPDEVRNFALNGHTKINPDGSFYLAPIIKNGVVGNEDPLEEQKRYQRVVAALTPEERHNNNMNELAEFGKAGLRATVDTALGVTGAGAAGAAPEAVTSGLQFLGRAALPGLEEAAGKAILNQGAKWVVKKAAPYIVGYGAVKVAKKTGLLDSLLELF